MGNKITKRLLSTHRLAAKEACELHSSLKAMGAKLPQYFQRDRSEVCRWDWYHFARDRIWWKLDNLVITLTRPFLLEWASRSTKDGRIAETSIEEGVCRKHCIQSARSTIDAIAAYMNRTALSKVACWYALYVTPITSLGNNEIDPSQIFLVPCCRYPSHLPSCRFQLWGGRVLAARS